MYVHEPKSYDTSSILDRHHTLPSFSFGVKLNLIERRFKHLKNSPSI